MYARVVRFTDVSPDRIAAIAERVEANEGPPEGGSATRLTSVTAGSPLAGLTRTRAV